MPELPEVEITARNLRRWMLGREIAAVFVHDHRVVTGSAAKFEKALIGRRVVQVDRRGKRMRWQLDDGAFVFCHLGMTGKWVRRPTTAPNERFEKVRLRLRNAQGKVSSVRYLDPRILGHIEIRHDDSPAWKKLGPDPLHDAIDLDRFGKLLAKRSASIKETLLDQSILAGVGNIQATDSLFLARIDPRKSAKKLTRVEVAALAAAIRESIDRTLAHEAGPEITYVEEAGAPNPFIVYGKAETPCPRCGKELRRVVQGDRATVFCAGCQR